MNIQFVSNLLTGIIGIVIIANNIYNNNIFNKPIDPYYYKKLYKPNHELQGHNPSLPNYSPSMALRMKIEKEKSNEKAQIKALYKEN